ncbi:MAG: DUF3846 domain-containing protein [Clostridium paraputrificum]
MRIMIKEPNKPIYSKEIKGDLENLQEIVGGYIEYVYFDKTIEKGISIIVNEEGLLMNLNKSIAFPVDHTNSSFSFLVGNVIFVGNKETSEGCENISLTDEQMRYIEKELFSKNQLIDYRNLTIIPIMEV